MWSSTSPPAGVRRSISSCSSSNGAPGRNRPRRVPTRETWVSTGHVGQPEREQQHAGGGLAPHAGQRGQVRARLRDRQLGEERQVRRVRQGAQDLLDPHGLLAVQAAGLDRGLDLLQRRVAHLLPGGEARAQAQVGDVAVAVVGRLREDGQDQLLEPLAVRRARPAGRR